MPRIYIIPLTYYRKTEPGRKVSSIDRMLLVSYRYSHSAWYHPDGNWIHLCGRLCMSAWPTQILQKYIFVTVCWVVTSLSDTPNMVRKILMTFRYHSKEIVRDIMRCSIYRACGFYSALQCSDYNNKFAFPRITYNYFLDTRTTAILHNS